MKLKGEREKSLPKFLSISQGHELRFCKMEEHLQYQTLMKSNFLSNIQTTQFGPPPTTAIAFPLHLHTYLIAYDLIHQ